MLEAAPWREPARDFLTDRSRGAPLFRLCPIRGRLWIPVQEDGADLLHRLQVYGACFLTSGGYRPALTISTLAARAADIVTQMKRREL